jgi:hypothetical protein
MMETDDTGSRYSSKLKKMQQEHAAELKKL